MNKILDPRVIKTRKLIMDAFMELSVKKEFNDITIKDITEIATVNRSTFYSHFVDKYDLLEKVLNEIIMRDVLIEVNSHEVIDEDTVEQIFTSIINFKKMLINRGYRCYKEYFKFIEQILKKELQKVFQKLGKKQWPYKGEPEIDVFSAVLSGAIYGSIRHWLDNQSFDLDDYVSYLTRFINV